MTSCKLVLALVMAATSGMTHAADIKLNFLGQQTIATGTNFGGVEVGGLSGLDYNPASGSFTVISDDRGERATPRFYDVDLSYGPGGFTGVTINSQTNMRRPDGTVFPASPRQVDPESIRHSGSGTLFWSSEGNFNTDPALRFQPFLREMTLSGTHLRDFAVPSQFDYVDNATTGARSNLVFESLTVAPGGSRLFTANEGALIQDGAIAALGNPSLARITQFDVATGAPIGQYAYAVAAIPKPPASAGAFADNGLVELLAISDDEFIAVERSFATGIGNTIKLFRVSLAGATDISGTSALASASFTPVGKSLLLDLDTLGIALDNVEGISWGPLLANGNRSIVLVSDNNFSASQVTQFLAFEVEAVPAPSGLALLAVLLPALAVLRRGLPVS